MAHKEPTWSQCDHYAGERVRHLRCVLVEAIPGPGSVKNTSIRQVNGGVSFGCICAHPYPKGTGIANYVAPHSISFGDLPALPGEVAAESMNETRTPDSSKGKVRVLVVDDNADAANSLGRLLSLLGKETRVATSGEAALEALRDFPADVVLLDLGMHGMDGIETARQIRTQPAWNTVRLIALTGWGQEQDKQRTVAAGFVAHLVKPVNIEQIEAAIAGVMVAKGRPSAL